MSRATLRAVPKNAVPKFDLAELDEAEVILVGDIPGCGEGLGEIRADHSWVTTNTATCTLYLCCDE